MGRQHQLFSFGRNANKATLVVIKRAIINTNLHKIIKQDFILVQKQGMTMATCKKPKKKVAQKNGRVTVGQIKTKIQKRNNKKVVKA